MICLQTSYTTQSDFSVPIELSFRHNLFKAQTAVKLLQNDAMRFIQYDSLIPIYL